MGEALRRIGEGASMIRTKGEPGTGNIVEAVRHMRLMTSQIRKVQNMSKDELMTEAKNLAAPYELLLQVHETGSLPVVNFAAGGVATPADAALMMHLGSDGVFVGSGIFKSDNPEKFAKAIVEATTHYQDYRQDRRIVQKSRHADERHRNFQAEPGRTHARTRLVIRHRQH